MSYNIGSLIDCPTVQIKLNEFTEKGTMPNEPAPELQFLTSTVNTSRVLETRVVQDGGTKLKTVQVIYTPRIDEAQVSTTLTTDCNAGNSAGALSTTYTIDPLVGVQQKESFVLSDLAHICQSNPEYFAQRVAANIDAAKRKMQTTIATQMAALYGKFASDNGETGLSVSNTLKTVATKYPAATDGGKWNPEALQEIMFSAYNSGFKGIPYVFGYGEIWRYWNYLIGLGNFSDGGLDFAKYVNQNQAAFLPSIKMHAALNNPSSGKKFLAVDAGSLFLLQYNRFDDPLNQKNDDIITQGIIVDPLSGVKFNYKLSKPCDESVTLIISTAFKVVGLPSDMYNASDRLYQTNGVLQFNISNS
jgi:hypothetical protein